MIKLLNTNKQTLHLITQVKDYYIESDLETADKMIHFLLPKQDASYVDLKQENYLQTEDDEFVIKEINYKEKGYVEVFGKLNVEGLRSKVLPTYESVGRPIALVMSDILVGTGWTYLPTDIPNVSRTIRTTDKTAHEIIIDCMNLYNLEVEFDSINKRVKVYQQLGENRGSYIHSDLNLKKTEFQSDTYDYRTRLYAYGKDGLTFAGINGGKEYVDNNTYSNKIIETIWRDDRYTNAASLRTDAIARLEKIAKPRLSYVVDVIQLTTLNPIYTILDFKLGDTVKIMDKELELIDHQRIVKLTAYPITPEKNKVHLGDTQLKFKTEDNKVEDIVADKTAIIRTELMAEIDRVSKLIGSPEKGYIVLRKDENGVIYEQLIMNTDDVATASKVWRWNLHGLGYSSTGYNGSYRLAITSEGTINADFITTGSLNAALIKTGIIMSNDGSTWIDLDTGEFNLQNRIKFLNNVFSITLDPQSIEDIVAEVPKNYTIIMSNENQSINTNHLGTTLDKKVITSDIDVYEGINKVNATITDLTLKNKSNQTISIGTLVKKDPTSTTSGSITWTIPANTTFTTDEGWIYLSFTLANKTYSKKLTWNTIKDGTDGVDGVNGKAVSIVTSQDFFTSTTMNVAQSKYVYSPTAITLQPILENVVYSKWQYSLDGTTWVNVTSGSNGLTINNSTKVLTILSTSNLYTTSQKSVRFKLLSTTGEFDIVNIARIHDSSDMATNVIQRNNIVHNINLSKEGLKISESFTEGDKTSTIISGGLITSGAISLSPNSTATTVNAGIKSDGNIRLWAGETKDRAQYGNFFVTQGGILYSKGCFIEAGTFGTFNYKSGNAGGKAKYSGASKGVWKESLLVQSRVEEIEGSFTELNGNKLNIKEISENGERGLSTKNLQIDSQIQKGEIEPRQEIFVELKPTSFFPKVDGEVETTIKNGGIIIKNNTSITQNYSLEVQYLK